MGNTLGTCWNKEKKNFNSLSPTPLPPPKLKRKLMKNTLGICWNKGKETWSFCLQNGFTDYLCIKNKGHFQFGHCDYKFCAQQLFITFVSSSSPQIHLTSHRPNKEAHNSESTCESLESDICHFLLGGTCVLLSSLESSLEGLYKSRRNLPYTPVCRDLTNT